MVLHEDFQRYRHNVAHRQYHSLHNSNQQQKQKQKHWQEGITGPRIADLMFPPGELRHPSAAFQPDGLSMAKVFELQSQCRPLFAAGGEG